MSIFSRLIQAVLLMQICLISKAQYPYPQQMGGYQGQQIQAYPPMQQMPMPAGMAGGMPGGVPMPMPIAMTQPRLPVVVMPFRQHKGSESDGKHLKSSKRDRHKRRRKHRKRKAQRLILSSGSDSTSSDRSSSSADVDFRSARKSKSKSRRHHVLTPVISYVTNDGYVVYQKKIKKEKAKEWLDLSGNQDQALQDSGEKSALSVEVGKKSGKRTRY